VGTRRRSTLSGLSGLDSPTPPVPVPLSDTLLTSDENRTSHIERHLDDSTKEDTPRLQVDSGPFPKPRIASAEFKQEGGIIGKLKFEMSISPQFSDDVGIPIDKDQADDKIVPSVPRSPEKVKSAENDSDQQQFNTGEVDEEEELLETPGKKGGFFRGLARGRRMSKPSSDVDHLERVSVCRIKFTVRL